MTDGSINGTGNSRYLKSVSNFLSLYPTYSDFVSALVAGTLPIDLNGINAAGWAVIGDALNKGNLLPDSVATALGLTGNPQVKDALLALSDRIDDTATNSIATGTYTGDGTATRTINLGFTPRAVLVLEYGNTTSSTSSSAGFRSGLAITGTPAKSTDSSHPPLVAITSGGFNVFYGTYQFTNALSYQFSFVAWR